jgi:hypothetical protein
MRTGGPMSTGHNDLDGRCRPMIALLAAILLAQAMPCPKITSPAT